MTTAFANWQHWMLICVLILGALALIYRVGVIGLSRRRQKQRIRAARVRSGHAPLDIPTTHGELEPEGSTWASLGSSSAGASPRAGTGAAQRQVVVDEQPTLRIVYNDPYGKLVNRTIEVEQLDLHRQAIIAKGNSLYDPRVYPLDRIVEARDQRSGHALNLGQWVDAVRMARRRRESQTDFGALGDLSGPMSAPAPVRASANLRR